MSELALDQSEVFVFSNDLGRLLPPKLGKHVISSSFISLPFYSFLNTLQCYPRHCRLHAEDRNEGPVPSSGLVNVGRWGKQPILPQIPDKCACNWRTFIPCVSIKRPLRRTRSSTAPDAAAELRSAASSLASLRASVVACV